MNQPLSHVQPNLDNVEAWLVKFALNRDEVDARFPLSDEQKQIIFNELVGQMFQVSKDLSDLTLPILERTPEIRGVKLDSLRRLTKQAYVCLFGLVVDNCQNSYDEGMARMLGAWSCVPHLKSDTALREQRLAMAYLLDGNPAYINKFVDALYAMQREYREITTYTDVQAVDGVDAASLRQRIFGSDSSALSITSLPTGEVTEL